MSADFFFQQSGNNPIPFPIGNSLRFRGAQQLTRTPAASGNLRTSTISCWFKKKIVNGESVQLSLFGCTGNGPFLVRYRYQSDQLEYAPGTSSAGSIQLRASHRDPSAWMHLVVVNDFNNANASERARIFINGVRQAVDTPAAIAQQDGSWNSANVHRIGQQGNFFVGHMAEVHSVDGTALDPTAFGEFNADGVWVPREVEGVTYGTNGFYLDFSDPDDIGADRSGNGNDFTATGFELTDTTSGVYDWMADSPTNNTATANPLVTGLATNYFDANLFVRGVGFPAGSYQTIPIPNDTDAPIYIEVELENVGSGGTQAHIAVGDRYFAKDLSSGAFHYYRDDGVIDGQGGFAPFTNGGIIGIVIHPSTNGLAFYNNGANQLDLTGINFSTEWYIYCLQPQAGDPRWRWNFGQQPWKASFVPPGVKPLSTAELNDVPITNPSEHFQTILGPGPSNGTTPLAVQYKTSNSSDTSTFDNLTYGKPATEEGNDLDHPMFSWAANISLGGFSDWYIPAKDELNFIYQGYRTNAPAGEEYATLVYRSASQNGTSNWCQDFGNNSVYGAGAQFSDVTKSSTTGYGAATVARAVRRVALTGSEPAVGTSYEGGFYAGEFNGFALIAAPKDGGEYGVGTGILDVAQRTFPNGLWWIKDRANSNQHQFVDSVRGGNLALTNPSYGTETSYSAPAGSSVAWCWNASDDFTGSGGTIASTGSRDVDAGFSIVRYSGNGSAGATVPHGLSGPPDMMFVKNLDDSGEPFQVYHSGMGADRYMQLHSPAGQDIASTRWNDTEPTNTVFSVGTSPSVNVNNQRFLAYCWHSVPGYSAFGTYQGTGTTDAAFCFTGFRPAFLMTKSTSNGDWQIRDNLRGGSYNPVYATLAPNSTRNENAASSIYNIDLLSNGFKIRGDMAAINGSGQTIIWAAWAEHPFGGSNVSPSPAR